MCDGSLRDQVRLTSGRTLRVPHGTSDCSQSPSNRSQEGLSAGQNEKDRLLWSSVLSDLTKVPLDREAIRRVLL